MRDKILIVDDEADIVSMLKDYFEFNGYDTITAVNGLEAIQKKLKSNQTLFCWILICQILTEWKYVCEYEILYPVLYCF